MIGRRKRNPPAPAPASLPAPLNPSVEGMVSEFHDTIGALQASHREITRLCARAEETAGELESFNRQILASISSGIVCFTPAGKVAMANPAARQILRLDASQPLAGNSAGDLWGEDSEIAALVRDGLADPRNRSRIELRIAGRGTPDAWVGASISVLRGRNDAAGGIVLLVTDLTEVRALRAELSLRQRLGAMGELTACIAHNFRNSLAAILGYTTLLSRRTSNDREVRRPIEAILREVQRMESEIRALLEGLRMDPSLEPRADLAEVTRGAVDTLRGDIENAGIELMTDLPAGAPAVRGDAGALGQMVSNLVRNAVQAMPSGGELRVTLRESPGGALELQVADSGEGIPRENLARVFEPFFTTREGGSGLGLALAKSTVDRLGGSIEIDSEPGRGTCFRVKLPLGEADRGR